MPVNENARSVGSRWAVFAVVSALCHHIGPAFGPLGEIVDGTRIADWVDLITPFAVVGLAAWALSAAPNVSRRSWWVFGVFAVCYVEGHGLHLAANSIHNQGPVGDAFVTAYFWDEKLGHILWFGAYPFIVAALVVCSRAVEVALTPWRVLAAVLFGFAFMTTSVEGQMVPVAIASCLFFIAYGLRYRRGLGPDVVIAFGLCAALLGIFGIWQGGFPEFSELGWI